MTSFSRELQMTVQAAIREAVSRRHAYVTVEHLLFALCHDEEGLDVLRNSGARLDLLMQELERFFEEDLERVPGDDAVDTRQTIAFHRVLQHALDHALSAEKEDVSAGDVLVALFHEPDSYAVTLLRSQGVTRLDMLQYISHGVSKAVDDEAEFEGAMGRSAGGEEAGEIPADPLAAFCTNLTARAASGELDPLIGRGPELERITHILARRRKNNPIFVGESGVGKTALAEGL